MKSDWSTNWKGIGNLGSSTEGMDSPVDESARKEKLYIYFIKLNITYLNNLLYILFEYIFLLVLK